LSKLRYVHLPTKGLSVIYCLFSWPSFLRRPVDDEMSSRTRERIRVIFLNGNAVFNGSAAASAGPDRGSEQQEATTGAKQKDVIELLAREEYTRAQQAYRERSQVAGAKRAYREGGKRDGEKSRAEGNAPDAGDPRSDSERAEEPEPCTKTERALRQQHQKDGREDGQRPATACGLHGHSR
jgi:hypothetical protein